MLNDRQKIDLDNWITGHWGEDQFKDDEPLTDDDRTFELPCTCDANADSVGTCQRHGPQVVHVRRIIVTMEHEDEKVITERVKIVTDRIRSAMSGDWQFTIEQN